MKKYWITIDRFDEACARDNNPRYSIWFVKPEKHRACWTGPNGDWKDEYGMSVWLEDLNNTCNLPALPTKLPTWDDEEPMCIEYV